MDCLSFFTKIEMLVSENCQMVCIVENGHIIVITIYCNFFVFSSNCFRFFRTSHSSLGQKLLPDFWKGGRQFSKQRLSG